MAVILSGPQISIKLPIIWLNGIHGLIKHGHLQQMKFKNEFYCVLIQSSID